MYSYTILSIDDPNVEWPETFNPNVEKINIHNNTLTPITEPYNQNQTDLGMALVYAYSIPENQDKDLFNNMPDIIWGGMLDAAGTGSLTHNICITENGDAGFANLAAQTAFQLLSLDITPHNCTQAPLPAVVFNARK
jgi:hypothetical protein